MMTVRYYLVVVVVVVVLSVGEWVRVCVRESYPFVAVGRASRARLLPSPHLYSAKGKMPAGQPRAYSTTPPTCVWIDEGAVAARTHGTHLVRATCSGSSARPASAGHPFPRPFPYPHGWHSATRAVANHHYFVRALIKIFIFLRVFFAIFLYIWSLLYRYRYTIKESLIHGSCFDRKYSNIIASFSTNLNNISLWPRNVLILDNIYILHW